MLIQWLFSSSSEILMKETSPCAREIRRSYLGFGRNRKAEIFELRPLSKDLHFSSWTPGGVFLCLQKAKLTTIAIIQKHPQSTEAYPPNETDPSITASSY